LPAFFCNNKKKIINLLVDINICTFTFWHMKNTIFWCINYYIQIIVNDVKNLRMPGLSNLASGSILSSRGSNHMRYDPKQSPKPYIRNTIRTVTVSEIPFQSHRAVLPKSNTYMLLQKTFLYQLLYADNENMSCYTYLFFELYSFLLYWRKWTYCNIIASDSIVTLWSMFDIWMKINNQLLEFSHIRIAVYLFTSFTIIWM